MKSIIVKTALFSVILGSIIFAGPNKSAELFVDCAPETPQIDSMSTCPTDSTFTVGIAIRGIQKMYGYQLYISIDTSHLRLISVQKGDDARPNILESSGGSINFTMKRSKDDSTQTLVGASLSGDDSTQCVNGSGLCALLTLKKRTDDTTDVKLRGVIVVNCELVDDIDLVCHKAVIAPGQSSVISLLKNVRRDKIEMCGGMIRISPQWSAECRLSITDISGREVKRFPAGTTVIDMRRATSGVYIVRVARNGGALSYPLVVSR
jgi:hypothetical protein